MRTPNTQCVLCAKPLYRRPKDRARTRYAACMVCRAKAQSVIGITDAQSAALASAQKKGTNYRLGYKHTSETKTRMSATARAFWCANPELAIKRGQKLRGAGHGGWKGGVSRLNISIRQMTENRRWMDAVKVRDGRCIRCGSTDELESHHIIELADLIENLGIRTRDDARVNAATLWDLQNGETLCRLCHWKQHGRIAA